MILSAFMEKNSLPDTFKRLVEESYFPLAERIFKTYKKQGSPYFVGVNGCQGSGKSTLSDYLSHYLSSTHQLNVVVVSLDDFYLSRTARNELAESVHPLLKTRGVPGTHNTELLESVLAKVKNRQTDFLIPRFNKVTDDPFDKDQWQCIDKPIDILILEGWCWGVTAQNTSELTTPINSLEKEEDQQSIWRNYVNEQLRSNYQPLYEYMNFWVALQAPSFDSVYKWRLEQEQKLIKTLSSTAQTNVMNKAQILNFIQYFQRLTTHGMHSLPLIAQTVFYLDESRSITQCVEKD
ncbi:zeta toxin family protein [Pseudocolwellia agarivorans]|uniref:zeta toxin family protein n=1 Tax=Pseudocolwellia agarivorans TaxID=1911682 RepID=UPI001FED173C|nr:zeta toxin family protein [Pseudocolwellia agarivorans]